MKRVGIVGFGFVGQAVYGSLSKDVIDDVVIYDKYKKIGSFTNALMTKVMFCCISTPSTEDGQDPTEYKEFLYTLVKKNYKGIVVIKSTILYSSIEEFVDKLNIVHNPEFLSQNTSVQDFAEQKVVILGGRVDHSKEVSQVYDELFDLRDDVVYEYCTIEESINFKYVHNVYHAYKVLFWNFVHEQFGNTRKYSDLYHQVVERNELSKIAADGKFGFGGHCFPKDLRALEFDKPNELTKFMIKYNKKLRGEDLF